MTAHTLQYVCLGLGFVGAILVALGGLGFNHYRIKAEKDKTKQQELLKSQEAVYSGVIEPGSDPFDGDEQRFGTNRGFLLLGDDLRIVTSRFPTCVISHAGKPFLTVKQKGGNIFVTATLVDYQGRHMVRIIENEFQANAETTFNPRQPDRHSLIVRDTTGQEVLNVRFKNPQTIRITGRFAIEGFSTPAIVDANDGLLLPTGDGMAHLTVDASEAPNGIIDTESGFFPRPKP